MDENRRKLKIISIGFVIAFSMVLIKAFKLQVVDRKDLIARSQDQILRERKIYPKRGSILDRNGNPLAINIQTYSIFAIPKNLAAVKADLKQLASMIPNLNYADLIRRLGKRTRFTWLARKVTLNEKQVLAIRAMKARGIHIESVPKRLYPNHELLGQTLGFVGIDNVGLSGVEYFFDEELRGKPKILKYIKDAKGRPVKFETTFKRDDGHEVVLSFDKDLQAFAEKALKEAVINSQADKGGIGIIDVKTGEILAMANYPTFDPNQYNKYGQSHRKLSFISDPFEPGSTFKTFTIASALENGIATPDTNYYCEQGKLKVEDHIIREAESKKKYEWLSVAEILKYSSNIGTTKIAFNLTYPKLKATLTEFGFGKKAGIELPGESRGIFNYSENVSPLSLSNISFGQGVATTGLQMLSAYQIIANDGLYLTPTILKNGNKEREPVKVLSQKTAKKIQRMLIDTVENGTGTKGKIPYFEIAGKTSTAQRVRKNGGYEGYISGFIGFPVNASKRFVAYVYIDNPTKGSYYGNTVAGPVFKKVSQYILYKNKDFKLAKFDDENKNIGNQFDSIKKRSSSWRRSGEGLVPNFIGLDRRSARKLAKNIGVDLVHKGIGVVSRQLPAAGNVIKEGNKVTLIYSPPQL